MKLDLSKYVGLSPEFGPLGEIVYLRTYARWNEAELRRETWKETVQRVAEWSANLASEKVSDEEVLGLFDQWFNLKAFPAGRSLWTAGTEYAKSFGLGSFNCSFTDIRRPRDFYDMTFLLMSGAGVGFRVTRDNVAAFNENHPLTERPEIEIEPYYYVGRAGVIDETQTVYRDEEVRIIVGDSRAGWATAIESYVNAVTGLYGPCKKISVNVDYVRPLGTPLKTFGGYASGPEPLIDFINDATTVLQADDRGWTSVKLLDLGTMIGRTVVAGGSRRCLPAGTLVKTTAGAIPIEAVEVGMEVDTPAGIRKVKNLFVQGNQETVRIKHQLGEFVCTPNHRMAVMTSPTTWGFKEAKKLTSDDRLAWDFSPWAGEATKVPPVPKMKNVSNEYIRATGRATNETGKHECEVCGRPTRLATVWNGKPLCNAHYLRFKNYGDPQIIKGWAKNHPVLPDEPTEDFAWLIGLIQGDGYVQYAGGKGHLAIPFDRKYPEIADKAVNVLQSIFPDGINIAKQDEENYFILKVHSRPFAEWLHENVKKPKEPITVPDWIKRASPSIRAAYLAGLFDADGSISNARSFRIVSTVYESLKTDVAEMLMTLGIAAKTKLVNRVEKGWQNIWNVDVAHGEFQKRTVDLLSQYASTKMPNEMDMQRSCLTLPANMTDVKNRSAKTPVGTLVIERETESTFTALPSQVISVEPNEVLPTFDIEVEDIHQFTANGLITHNSACIALGDADDYEFLEAKTGNWYETAPWRSQANNSVIFHERPTADQLRKILNLIAEYGEPGFINGEEASRRRPNWRGLNPCAEILLDNQALCNLTTINMMAFVENGRLKIDDLERTIKLQARHNLRVTCINIELPEWDAIQKRDRLLGMSITGWGDFLDATDMNEEGQKRLLEFMRTTAHNAANEYADELGIPRPLLITTIKPEGSITQLPGVSSGVHPSFGPYYIRRIRIAAVDAVAETMKQLGYKWEVDLFNPSTLVFEIPVATPAKRYAYEYTALEMLDRYKLTMKHYVDHNTSITVYMDKDEINGIIDWLLENWDDYVAVSFLPKSDDTYPQMPYERITKEQYEELVATAPTFDRYTLEAVEYGQMNAVEDFEVCATGACPTR